ncbi:MAG: hypothetical protein ACRDRO_24810 [Pseudonocardiaceae bacterium]
MDHELRTSHRRTERAGTGAGGLFERDDSRPGEHTGDHRRADRGQRADDPEHVGGDTLDTGRPDGLGSCAEVPLGAARRLSRSA